MQTDTSIKGSLDSSHDPSGIRIETLSLPADLHGLEELQAAVWGGGSGFVVPAHLLHIVATTGGIVIGAYRGDRAVGFVFGMLARRDGTLYHASHMLGIHPEYQGHGIGAALKWAQRDHALAQGLDLMTWTFDPLEARNAYFNLHKLGVVCGEYEEDVYGDLGDELNRGLPSDRLIAEWRLSEPSPLHEDAGTGGLTILTQVDGAPRLQLDHGTDGRSVRIAAPPDIQRLKRENPEVAQKWRLFQRTAMQWALAQGYVVCDFVDGSFILKRREEVRL